MQAPGLEIRFPANHASFGKAFACLNEALDREQLDRRSRYNIELVFDEIVSNIIRYGAVGRREPEVCVTLVSRPHEIVLTFDDDGVPFDPTAPTERAASSLPEEETLGGFGLVLVHGAASSLSYRRTEQGRNLLIVTVPRNACAT
jgi:anti-sigma regulatory factor (Ser/Thr protein kinase)